MHGDDHGRRARSPRAFEIQLWLDRLNRRYRESRRSAPPSIEKARAVLFDATARVSRREEILVALIDHPDPRASKLLDHPALPVDTPRLRFARVVCRRRRRRRERALRAA